MTVPTPEQFLGTPSTEDDEDEVPPESAAAPREVVENSTTFDPNGSVWTMDPGAVWQLPPTDIAGYVAQIAADVRRIAEATNVQHTTDGTNIYVEPVVVPEAMTAELNTWAKETGLGQTQGFVPAEEPIFDETSQPYVEQLADLEAEKQTLTELVEEIKGIVKPSKSQVSLEVKAAIERWANPQVDMTEGDQRLAEAQSAGEVTPTSSQGTEDAGTHTRTLHPGSPDYCAECSQAAQDWVEWPCPAIIATEPEVGPDPHPEPVIANDGAPAATDHVEAWRKYAREVRPEAKWEGMNRSQIRTALGIAQPVQDPA